MLNVQCIRIGLFITLVICAVSSVHSSEEYAAYPGSRAAAMAGVFTAQADDSTAIWYNAAALAQYDFVKGDATLEFGQRPVSDNGSLSTESFLKYAAAYSRLNLPNFQKTPVGIGISYFSPIKLTRHIDAPQSLVNDNEFGNINTTYHQISSMATVAVGRSLSFGATLDFIWLSIDCVNYSPCVDNGPTALGSSLSTMLNLIDNKSIKIQMAATWRTKAKLAYRSTPQSGIGTVLIDYVPDRPDSKTLGFNLQIPSTWVLINTNIIYERVAWSSSIERGDLLNDFQNVGASVEFASLTGSGKTYSLRAGSKLSENRRSGEIDIGIVAMGIGYEVKRTHVIDIAYVYTKFRHLKNNAQIWSLSYSWQFK